jgi:flagellar basal body-associated protein FliL
MKKAFVIMLAFALAIGGTVTAQVDKSKQKTSTTNHKTKVKPTSSTGEKLHNVVSKNNKYSGVKAKSKNKHTNKKSKVEIKKNKIEVKTSKG